MERPDDLERQRRIEAFVRGRLSGEDRDAFELAMAGDAELRDAVELERTMQEVLRHEKSLRFHDLVRTVSNGLDKEEAGSKHDQVEEVSHLERIPKDAVAQAPEVPVIHIGRKRNWAWLAAAASVTLVASYFAMRTWTTSTYEELAYTAARDYQFSTTRGEGAASAELERTDRSLTALIRRGELDKYLQESAKVLESDSAYVAHFGPDVHRDRAKVYLGLKRTALAAHEADILRKSLDSGADCDADVIEGLAYAIDGMRELASKKLKAANDKGCLDEVAKPLILE